jgi:hypothetical protein
MELRGDRRRPRERQRCVDGVFAELTQEGLERVCESNLAAGFPRDTAVPVLRCLHTLLNEEWAHYECAVRVLAVLEGST